MGAIQGFPNVRFWKLRVKTGPTASRIELGFRFEQRLVASFAHVGAFGPLCIQFARKGSFRSMFAHDPEFFSRQVRAPIVVLVTFVLVTFTHDEGFEPRVDD